MTTLLFFAAAAVLIASVIRRPKAMWQRAIAVAAVVAMLAVVIAWGIEFVLQTPGG